MKIEEFEYLIEQQENVFIDFKSEEYNIKIDKNKKKEIEEEKKRVSNKKADLIKDILSMANITIDTCSYIIMGVSEDEFKKKDLRGVNEFYIDDDANLQQIVNLNLNHPIDFEYNRMFYKNKIFSYIKIYPSNYYFYLNKLPNKDRTLSNSLNAIRSKIFKRVGSTNTDITDNIEQLEKFFKEKENIEIKTFRNKIKEHNYIFETLKKDFCSFEEIEEFLESIESIDDINLYLHIIKFEQKEFYILYKEKLKTYLKIKLENISVSEIVDNNLLWTYKDYEEKEKYKTYINDLKNKCNNYNNKIYFDLCLLEIENNYNEILNFEINILDLNNKNLNKYFNLLNSQNQFIHSDLENLIYKELLNIDFSNSDFNYIYNNNYNFIKLIGYSQLKDNSTALNNLGVLLSQFSINSIAIKNFKKSSDLGDSLGCSNYNYNLGVYGDLNLAKENLIEEIKNNKNYDYRNSDKLSFIDKKLEEDNDKYSELLDKSKILIELYINYYKYSIIKNDVDLKSKIFDIPNKKYQLVIESINNLSFKGYIINNETKDNSSLLLPFNTKHNILGYIENNKLIFFKEDIKINNYNEIQYEIKL